MFKQSIIYFLALFIILFSSQELSGSLISNKIKDIQLEFNKYSLPKNLNIEDVSFAIFDSYQKYPILRMFSTAEILNLIKKESSFNTNAISKKGAKGLMQLMPLMSKAMRVKDVFNSYHNVRGGLKFLAYLSTKYQDKELALYSYYAGETKVNKYIKQGKMPTYIKKYIKGIIV